MRDWKLLLERGGGRAALRGLMGDGGGRPVIATGHQAGLWHPGILAKDAALAEAARRFAAAPIHVVVDHDVIEALQLELPVRRGDRLSVHTVQLAAQDVAVPTGCQAAPDPASIVATLRETRASLGDALAADLEPLIDAFAAAPPCRTLAELLATVRARLVEPWCGVLPLVYASALHRLDAFRALVADMLSDPQRCTQTYNAAAAEHAQAGVAALAIEAQRIELPLWALGWDQPRQRVYAQRSDAAARLSLADGRPLEPNHSLAPRAILLSAFLRRDACALFIHGRGGAVYDRVTDAWWRAWRGETLPAAAVVSADLTLSFDVPVATRDELTHAIWLAHHLPHNLDRALALATDEAQHKRLLLARMDADRDRVRRRQAFEEIHAINHRLTEQHADVLRQAQGDVARRRAGVANRDTAGKRDWCVGLYPPPALQALVEALRTR